MQLTNTQLGYWLDDLMQRIHVIIRKYWPWRSGEGEGVRQKLPANPMSGCARNWLESTLAEHLLLVMTIASFTGLPTTISSLTLEQNCPLIPPPQPYLESSMVPTLWNNARLQVCC